MASPEHRIIDDIDAEPEPLRSAIYELVEAAAAEYVELFPPEKEKYATTAAD